ncbi:primase-helicase family protein [Maritalea sp.]|jgi:hypothetical protein|uniref:primase-helicase family protein n=1 Tax=Maritalea sp. TaxID=2003361 RepID=UPI0039E2B178
MSNPIQSAIEDARSIEPMPTPEMQPDSEQDQLGGFDIEQMNNEWALVLLGSKAALVHEQPQADVEDRIQIRTVDAFHRWYDNKFVYWQGADGKMKPMTYSKVWMSSKHRRQYQGLEFFPNPDGADSTPGYLNMWHGFDAEAKRGKNKYDVFEDHLLTNVCGGDKDLRNWVFGWFAHMFQRPRERTATALVFRGKMGAGKSTIGEVIGSLIQSHYFQVDDPRYIVGNFNAHMAKCLLLQAEEAVWAGDKNAEGRLKGLVAAKTQMIEAKGVDPIRVKNYVRLCMTSNEDWVVPAGKDERRFCVLDVGDGAKQNHEYFAEMHEQLNNGGREALLYDLLNFDLSTIDIWTIPLTTALLEQKVRSLDSVEAWWFDRLAEGELFTGEGVWESEVSKNALHADYLKQADAIGIKRRADRSQFGKLIHQMVPGLKTTRPRSMRSEDVRKRGRCFSFPSLEECRASFCDVVGQEVDWTGGMVKVGEHLPPEMSL